MRKTEKIIKSLICLHFVMIFLVLCSLLLTGCGKPHKTRYYGDECDPSNPTIGCDDNSKKPPKIDPVPIVPIRETDSKLESYVREYVNEAYAFGVEVNLSKVAVVFGETSGRGSSILAYCSFNNSGQNVIVINESKWLSASEAKRKLILTHEMGHCERGLAHNWNFLPPELIPFSLMYPYALKDAVFFSNYRYYMQEFFHSLGPKMNNSATNGLEQSLIECDLHDHL